MGLNLMTFQLDLGDLACPLPTCLLAQVRGGRGSWREIQMAAKLGVMSQVDFLTLEDGRWGDELVENNHLGV